MAKGNSDLELLIKMMGQTGSDNDNLALVAIRTANKQVRKLAGSWDELLRGHFTIAADPFEGINFPGFGNGSSAPPAAPDRSTWRRGTAPNVTPQQPPPPQPPPGWTGSRPQAPPNPMHAQASAGFSTAQQKRTNSFRAVCHKCGSWCSPGQGYLDGRSNMTNQWKVICIDDISCAQRAAKPKPKRATGAAKSTDNLTNMLD